MTSDHVKRWHWLDLSVEVVILYIFLYVFFLFFFFSLSWHHLFQLEVRERAQIQQFRWKELEHWIWLFLSCQSVSVLTSPAVPLCWEYWKYIRYCKRREKKEHPLHGHATSDGQQMNRRPGWAKSGWTDNNDEEMRWPPSPCPRERDGIDFSMMAQDWSASWMLVVSPALGEEKGRGNRQVCTFCNAWKVQI